MNEDLSQWRLLEDGMPENRSTEPLYLIFAQGRRVAGYVMRLEPGEVLGDFVGCYLVDRYLKLPTSALPRDSVKR